MHLLGNSSAIMNMHIAHFCREMFNVVNTRFLKNFCGQYFGRYNAVWSICGQAFAIFFVAMNAPFYQSQSFLCVFNGSNLIF